MFLACGIFESFPLKKWFSFIVYLTEVVQRLIIHHASSEMSHSFDQKLNGIVVCSFVFLFDFRALVSS